MAIRRKCVTCGKLFKPKTVHHKFCKRPCFKKDYNKRLRKKAKVYPNFLCPKCNKLAKLDFNPKKNTTKWSEFVCPYCGYKNNFDY